MMHESHDGWDEDGDIIRGVADTYDFGRHDHDVADWAFTTETIIAAELRTSATDPRVQAELKRRYEAMTGPVAETRADRYDRLLIGSPPSLNTIRMLNNSPLAIAALLNLADYHGVR